MLRILSFVVALALLLTVGLWWLQPEDQAETKYASLVASRDLLSENAEGFERVTRPRAFRFPRDHSAHTAYRHEWWYFTGNLQAANGRPFGYQFTLFRFSLIPKAPLRTSSWAPQSVYMGHLAITDIEGEAFHTRQKLSRDALGLAGAVSEPFAVWLEDWRVQGAPERIWPLRVRARSSGLGIDLTLQPGKPLVLQGDQGLSRKGPELGNASYYYSFPRLESRGTVTLNEEVLEVSGRSWMDREWGSSALGVGVEGWDWFALQLEDGRDLMFYHLRRSDGSADPHSGGVVIEASGSTESLSIGDVGIEVLADWNSPVTGVSYPAAWRISIPSHELHLEVRPRLANQEWTEPIRYWEGAVTVLGDVVGLGYVELTGYGEQ